MKTIKTTILVLSFLSFLSLAKAETFMVTTTDDDSAVANTNCNSTGDTTSGTCSLRGAVSVAESGDVIELGESTYCISTGPVDIYYPITLKGQGMNKTILDGGNGSGSLCAASSYQILNIIISSGNFTLDDMTLQGGSKIGNGGAMSISGGGNFHLQKVKITKNTSSQEGGGISISGGTISIEDSVIDSNQTTGTGSLGGGGIHITSGTLTLHRSVVSNNTVYGKDGGGIKIRGDSVSVTITNSTISGNQVLDSSTGRGGGIYFGRQSVSGSPVLTIQNTTIIGNSVTATSAIASTGGLYVGAGTANLISTIVAGNSFGSGTGSTDDCVSNAISGSFGDLVSLGHNFIPSSTCSASSTTGSGDVTSTAFSSSVLDTSLTTVNLGDMETKIHAIPSTSSPLYNAGDCSTSGVTTDQRGYYRNDGSCDIGSHEFGATSYCGDATKDTLEECDDGNSDNTDTCTDACENASCGDGYIQASNSETCDDGNTTDGDGCSSACVSETIFDGDGDGYLNDGTDCDDTNASIYPGATESCNEKDDDCDGETDEAGTTVGATSWCLDNDGDGYADENAGCDMISCTQPVGYVKNAVDCDDTNSSIHPGATEVANDGIDRDCDGDDDPDNDGDRYYDDDCDDTNPDIYPDATEIPDNGVDENCDPSDDLSGGSSTGGSTGAGSGGSSTGETGSTGGTSGSESTSGSSDGGATGSDPSQQPASGGGGGCSFQVY